MVKLYQSKAWLTKRYVVDKLTAQEIADQCGTSQQTIVNWLNKYGLIRSPRTWKRGI